MNPHPRQIALGVVGRGAEWEALYGPVLSAVSRKARIAAEYTVPVKNRPVGKLSNGTAQYCSLREFFSHPGLRGAVLLAPAWCGRFVTHLALQAECAVYFSSPPLDDVAFVVEAAKQEQLTGVLLMPEFRLRFTPTTLRLRELIATQLGSLDQIHLELAAGYRGSRERAITELIDWCQMLWPAAPAMLLASCTGPATPEGAVEIQLEWARNGSTGKPLVAQLCLPPEAAAPVEETASDSWPLTGRLSCQRGTITILDACHLEWKCGTETGSESLQSERSAVEVSLDLFTRRLAGGLVPVPTFGDLARALCLGQQTHRSLQEHRSVSCSE